MRSRRRRRCSGRSARRALSDGQSQRDAVALTVGTAGHIDHGKTWLVRALTGKDTDRLPEEQRRGISIDLGYAPLELADGRRLSLVDVPGHERFVRTMVAGATGIDLFLLVIDAAEGARPQTARAPGDPAAARRRAPASSRSPRPTSSTRRRSRSRSRRRASSCPAAEVVAVSAKTGAGLDELRAALAQRRRRVSARDASGPARLYVDRVFTLRGIGTVVTGTLWSGTIAEGDTLASRAARRRGPGAHRAGARHAPSRARPPASASRSGCRASSGAQLRRGDALVTPGAFPISYRLDVELEELTPIDGGARVSVHHGTSRVAARVARVGERTAQLRLAAPVVAVRGDRVVLRGETTLGGAIVLDPAPPRRLEARAARAARAGDPASIVAATVDAPVAVEVARRTGPAVAGRARGGAGGGLQAGGWAFSQRMARGDAATPSSSACARAPRSLPSSPGSRWPSCCRPSHGRRRSCRCCRSSVGAGWHISRASRHRSARGRGGRGARARARARPAWRR